MSQFFTSIQATKNVKVFPSPRKGKSGAKTFERKHTNQLEKYFSHYEVAAQKKEPGDTNPITLSFKSHDLEANFSRDLYPKALIRVFLLFVVLFALHNLGILGRFSKGVKPWDAIPQWLMIWSGILNLSYVSFLLCVAILAIGRAILVWAFSKYGHSRSVRFIHKIELYVLEFITMAHFRFIWLLGVFVREDDYRNLSEQFMAYATIFVFLRIRVKTFQIFLYPFILYACVITRSLLDIFLSDDADIILMRIFDFLFSFSFIICCFFLAYFFEKEERRLFYSKYLLRFRKTVLENENQISETLLVNIFPPVFFSRMDFNKTPKFSQQFDSILALLVDIVSFTKYCSLHDSIDVVKFLDRLYSRFDRLTIDYSQLKVKSIGDGYIAMSNPFQSEEDDEEHLRRNARLMCEMGLQMEKKLGAVNVKHEKSFKIRVGIACSSGFVAILGRKRLTFDLWGQIVDDLEELEASAPPNKVNVNLKVRQLAGDSFKFTENYSHNSFVCAFGGVIQPITDNDRKETDGGTGAEKESRRFHSNIYSSDETETPPKNNRESRVKRTWRKVWRKLLQIPSEGRFSDYLKCRSRDILTNMKLLFLQAILIETAILVFFVIIVDRITRLAMSLDFAILGIILAVQSFCCLVNFLFFCSSVKLLRSISTATCIHCLYIVQFCLCYAWFGYFLFSSFKAYKLFDAFVSSFIFIVGSFSGSFSYILVAFCIWWWSVIRGFLNFKFKNTIALQSPDFNDLKKSELILNVLTGIFFAFISFMRESTNVHNYEVSVRAQRKFSKIKEREEINSGLLQSVLPKRVILKMKMQLKKCFEIIDNACVSFASVLFPPEEPKTKPRDSIVIINNIFSLFDFLVESFNCEKIKSTGTSYLFCGLGDPTANSANVIACAIAFQNEIARANLNNEDSEKKESSSESSTSSAAEACARVKKLKLKVGCATGKVYAGVLGTRSFLYDIFGDVVNFSSRLSYAPENGGIMIDKATKSQFEAGGQVQVQEGLNINNPKIAICYEGLITLKGKNEVPVYSVEY